MHVLTIFEVVEDFLGDVVAYYLPTIRLLFACYLPAICLLFACYLPTIRLLSVLAVLKVVEDFLRDFGEVSSLDMVVRFEKDLTEATLPTRIVLEVKAVKSDQTD